MENNKTYRIQVWFENRWKWGLHDYTLSEAANRLNQLKSAGIKARIRHNSELFI